LKRYHDERVVVLQRSGPVDESVANPQAVLPLQQAKRFAKTPA